MPRCSICDRSDFNDESIFHDSLTAFDDDNDNHVIEIRYDRKTKSFICDECMTYVDDSLDDFVIDDE